VVVPLAGVFAVRATAVRPSPVEEVNELRRTTDVVQARADAIVATRLGTTSVDPSRLDYSTRLALITQEMEERLAPQEQRRQAHARETERLGRALRWMSPSLAFTAALADLAGTGTTRHHQFLAAVRTFQLDLRAFMYPRVLAQARSPHRRCPSCPGRLFFTDYDAIPRFSMPDETAAARLAAAAGTAAWLALLASAIAVTGVGWSRRWTFGA
jgi:hypothetical protein